VLLLKGSRGVALETLLPPLQAGLAGDTEERAEAGDTAD